MTPNPVPAECLLANGCESLNSVEAVPQSSVSRCAPLDFLRDSIEGGPTLTALELFAGAGGLALGAHAAHFDHVAVVELNPAAHATIRRNSVELLNIAPSRVLHRDAREVDYSEYAGKVDLLTGGPPCQPFSQGGGCKGHDDHRNQFPELFRALAQVRPRAILIENVRGLLLPQFKDYAAYLTARMRFPLFDQLAGESWEAHFARLQCLNEDAYSPDERYFVGMQLVDAADFGVPQRRLRVLWMGFRADLGVCPFSLLPTHSLEALLYEQWISGAYWDRHEITNSDAHMTKSLRLSVERMRRSGLRPLTAPWSTVRDAIADLPDSVPRGQLPIVADHVQHPGARSYRGHNGSSYDLPAKALKAGDHGTPGGENAVVDEARGGIRYFTIREAARLQTFPDEWRFDGTWGAAIRQLGNAVPVRLAQCFTRAVHERLCPVL